MKYVLNDTDPFRVCEDAYHYSLTTAILVVDGERVYYTDTDEASILALYMDADEYVGHKEIELL